MALTAKVGTDDNSLESSVIPSETNEIDVREEQSQKISPEHEAYPADQNTIDPGQSHMPGLDPEADELADEEK